MTLLASIDLVITRLTTLRRFMVEEWDQPNRFSLDSLIETAIQIRNHITTLNTEEYHEPVKKLILESYMLQVKHHLQTHNILFM